MSEGEALDRDYAGVGRWVVQFWGAISTAFLVMAGAFVFGKMSMQPRIDELEQKEANLTGQLASASDCQQQFASASDYKQFLAAYLRYVTYRDLVRESRSGDTTALKRKLEEAEETLVAKLNPAAVQLMSSLNDVSGIPKGKNLIIVAAVSNVLHFRIFDGDGKAVVDTDEKRLTEQARQIEDLRDSLETLRPPHELTRKDKDRVTKAVTSIVGRTTAGPRVELIERPTSGNFKAIGCPVVRILTDDWPVPSELRGKIQWESARSHPARRLPPRQAPPRALAAPGRRG